MDDQFKILISSPSEVEEDEKHTMEHYGRRQSSLEIILFKANSRIKEQFFYDKRFHPSVIGGILLVFLLSVAYFIAYMEGYKYFDAFYACFITYSTIGFGDIDIFVSVRKKKKKLQTNLTKTCFLESVLQIKLV